MSAEITSGALLVAEYDRLKEEQKTRIGFRDNLLYATLGSMAAVVAAALQNPGRPYLLLLLPPVSVVLGWTYLVNDEKVSAISHYIRDTLIPALESMTATTAPVFGWEFAHRADPRRRTRKLLQLIVDLIAFFLAPVAAIIVVWTSAKASAWSVAISAVEVVAVTVLGAQMIAYAELRPRGRMCDSGAPRDRPRNSTAEEVTERKALVNHPR
ncbi:hypothetical protein [Micromonospora sp. NPDC005806]|uniref:hypothetical protein n=1 Tax=Micromonospora sp. NPDC005806 TaxID=3364234 RepID=UPI0036C6C80B